MLSVCEGEMNIHCNCYFTVLVRVSGKTRCVCGVFVDAVNDVLTPQTDHSVCECVDEDFSNNAAAV